MEFREINKSNYMECILLKVKKEQETFVADNARSLLESIYEEGIYVRGIYHNDTMIGFVLFDYDTSIPGWSMSRFMIGEQYQNRGYGKKAVIEFIKYFKETIKADKLYISVELDNKVAYNMYKSLGFKEIQKISYSFNNMTFHEIQMKLDLI